MIIICQTVSVDYAPQLSQTLQRWVDEVDYMLVVTADRDTDTEDVASRFGSSVYHTDVFWERGALFNKGAAIARGFDAIYKEQHIKQLINGRDDVWHLFVDADALPPVGWRRMVEQEIDHRGGFLYGAHRKLESGVLIPEGELAGSFHLAKITDPQMLVRPIVDVHWRHAGNYDSTFQYRWPPQCRVKLTSFHITHVGQPFSNWCGVGKQEELKRVFGERHRRGTWVHESIDPEENS